MISKIGANSPAFGKIVMLDDKQAVNTDHVVALKRNNNFQKPVTDIYVRPYLGKQNTDLDFLTLIRTPDSIEDVVKKLNAEA